MDGAHHVRGFTNRDIRQRLAATSHLKDLDEPKKQSAKVGRLLHCLHTHRLVAKIPRSRKWRTTETGRRLMATAIQIRESTFRTYPPWLPELPAQTRRTHKLRIHVPQPVKPVQNQGGAHCAQRSTWVASDPVGPIGVDWLVWASIPS